MLTTLKRAMRSSRSATTIAGLSLVVASVGVAGAATLPDEASEEATSQVQDLEVPASEEADERATDAHENGQGNDVTSGEGEAPAWLADLHSFIESNDPSEMGCDFGHGVAAIASQGNAELPEECGTDANGGNDVDSANSSDNGLSTANDHAAVDVPADRSQGEESSAEGSPGYNSENNPGNEARSNAGGPPSDG